MMELISSDEKIPLFSIFILLNQIQLSNTFDNTTEIHHALKGIIKARGGLLASTHIVKFSIYILNTMCFAFDQVQNSHTIEVNLVLHPPHSFQKHF